MERRRFLDWLIRLSGTALGAFVLYPVVRYLVPPKIPEATTRRVVAATADELSAGSFKIFPFSGRPGILIRKDDGEYCAMSATCTHLDCTVQYREDWRLIWCACHDGKYTLEGKNISGPPPRPLEQFQVHVTDVEIIVEKAKA